MTGSRWAPIGASLLCVACGPTGGSLPPETVEVVELEPEPQDVGEPSEERSAERERVGGAWWVGYHEGPHEPPDTVARMASSLLVVPSDGMRSNQQSSLFLVP